MKTHQRKSSSRWRIILTVLVPRGEIGRCPLAVGLRITKRSWLLRKNGHLLLMLAILLLRRRALLLFVLRWHTVTEQRHAVQAAG